jgi:hypothetical protein
MQAILNMSKEVALAWKLTSAASRQAAESAGDLYRVSFLGNAIKQEWSTFWMQIASIFSGAMQIIEMATYGVLHAANALLEKYRSMPAWAKIALGGGGAGSVVAAASSLAEKYMPGIGRGDTSFHRQPVNNPMGRPESAWEKMGLIIHGGIGGNDYAKQVAENTRKMLDIMIKKGGGLLDAPSGYGINMGTLA